LAGIFARGGKIGAMCGKRRREKVVENNSDDEEDQESCSRKRSPVLLQHMWSEEVKVEKVDRREEECEVPIEVQYRQIRKTARQDRIKQLRARVMDDKDDMSDDAEIGTEKQICAKVVAVIPEECIDDFIEEIGYTEFVAQLEKDHPIGCEKKSSADMQFGE
jgi:hypothetical protein